MWLIVRQLKFIWGGKHASQIGRCEGPTGADESKGAVRKGDDLGGHGVCQKRK